MNQKENKYVKKILNKYQKRKISKLDELKMLDAKTKKTATIFAYSLGTSGTLIFGFGMSISMKVILANFMWIGITLGGIGLVIVVLNYFIYLKLLKKGKIKYSDQIINLSNQLLNE